MRPACETEVTEPVLWFHARERNTQQLFRQYGVIRGKAKWVGAGDILIEYDLTKGASVDTSGELVHHHTDRMTVDQKGPSLAAGTASSK